MKAVRISQQRIARDLGVSQALVSLVLNGKRENISSESYERIWKHALAQGYRPKGMTVNGHSLATNNAGFILRAGLRLYTQSNFFSHIQHGMHESLHEHGCNTVFLGSEDSLRLASLKRKLAKEKLLGLVLMGQMEETFVRRLRALHPNLVAVSASYPGLCHSVTANENQALDLLAEHLVALGHREFAWVGGNKLLRQNATRRYALEQSLAQRGLRLAPAFAVDVAEGDRLGGRHVAQTILARCTRKKFPTAWICLNGLMARGVLNYLAQQSWHVPNDISVAAVDATRICEEEHPRLTGAHADPEQMGAKVAELLIKASHSEEQILSDIVLPAKLTVRETTAPL